MAITIVGRQTKMKLMGNKLDRVQKGDEDEDVNDDEEEDEDDNEDDNQDDNDYDNEDDNEDDNDDEDDKVGEDERYLPLIMNRMMNPWQMQRSL
jgi:hypothetical protein